MYENIFNCKNDANYGQRNKKRVFIGSRNNVTIGGFTLLLRGFSLRIQVGLFFYVENAVLKIFRILIFERFGFSNKTIFVFFLF